PALRNRAEVVESVGPLTLVPGLFGQLQCLFAAGHRLLVLAQRPVRPGHAREGREALGVVQLPGRRFQGLRAVRERLLRIVALRELGELGQGGRALTPGQRGKARLDPGGGRGSLRSRDRGDQEQEGRYRWWPHRDARKCTARAAPDAV